MTTFMQAQDLGSEGDFAKALALLEKLEGLLNAAPQAKKRMIRATTAPTGRNSVRPSWRVT